MGCCRKVGEGLENSLYEPATSAPVLKVEKEAPGCPNPIQALFLALALSFPPLFY